METNICAVVPMYYTANGEGLVEVYDSRTHVLRC